MKRMKQWVLISYRPGQGDGHDPGAGFFQLASALFNGGPGGVNIVDQQYLAAFDQPGMLQGKCPVQVFQPLRLGELDLGKGFFDLNQIILQKTDMQFAG
jgi:hypothetical protein